jgi:hypothetical protein
MKRTSLGPAVRHFGTRHESMDYTYLEYPTPMRQRDIAPMVIDAINFLLTVALWGALYAFGIACLLLDDPRMALAFAIVLLALLFLDRKG